MRYEGRLEVIKGIEQSIRKNTMCFERKPKTYDNEFGIQSAVRTIVLDIVTANYMYPVRLLFDERPGSMSVIDVKDKDVVWLFKTCPNMNKLVGQLDEQRNEKQDLIEGKIQTLNEVKLNKKEALP